MNAEDIAIAIPSHARTERLQYRTLALLQEWDLLHRAIVFVAPGELDEYRAAVGDRVKVMPGRLGVKHNRDAILDYVPDGRPVLQMDDDVHGLFRRVDEKTLELLTREQFLDLVERGFREMDNAGARLWGVYPVTNPYFMKKDLRVGLSYIIASFMGYRGDRDPASPLRTLREDGEKEDFERSLQCYVADGAVVRIENVCVKHDNYSAEGGLHASRTHERVHEASLALVERFPGLAHLNTSKKSGWTEVRLKDRRDSRQRVSLEDLVKEL